MSARKDDPARVCEILEVIVSTQRQIEELGLTGDAFIHPSNAAEELMADGLVSRVLRVTEETGCLSSDLEQYGVPVRSARDMRNIIAHTYRRVDRVAIWQTVVEDFPSIRAACERYCTDRGIALGLDPDAV